MKKRLLIFLLVALCLASSAFAQAPKKEITLSTYILGIDEYAEQTGSYAISYALIMDCNYDCNIDDLVLLNGWIRNIVPLREEETGGRYLRSYRLFGHLVDHVELQKYPFDTQTISIAYEHKTLQHDELDILPGPFVSVDSAVGLPGWEFEGAGAEVHTRMYITNRAYDKYVHTLVLKRGELGAFFTHFFPVLLIMTILVFTYILKLDKVDLRLGISSSILLAAMVFHLTIANRLPPLGYLTFAGKFMILTYIVALFTFMVNIGLLKLTELKLTKAAARYNVTARHIALAAIPIAYIILFVFFR